MNMNAMLLFLEPRSPLVFRSGRPFGGVDAGGGGHGFDFPIPATVAGAIRAVYADAVKWKFDGAESADALVEAVRLDGVVLARRAHDAGCVAPTRVEALFPKPSDAVYMTDGAHRIGVYRLAPQIDGWPSAGTGCDLPPGLCPVLPESGAKGKPAAGPDFWSADHIAFWLAGRNLQGLPASSLGVARPPADRRTHVVIDPGRMTAIDGGLFESSGVDFGPRKHASNQPYQQYGLLAQIAVNLQAIRQASLDGAIGRVGADGRMARYAVATGWPACPKDLASVLDAAKEGGRVRMVLSTPAVFAGGWQPEWLQWDGGGKVWVGRPPSLPDWELKLDAAAIERYQPYSGWAMRASGGVSAGGRAIRRMAPAGSVYWFEVRRAGKTRLSEAWMQSVCGAEYAREGFGLALWGTGTSLATDRMG